MSLLWGFELVFAATVLQAIVHYVIHQRGRIRRAKHRRSGGLVAPSSVKFLQLNVWSGSRYVGELSWSSGFRFIAYESRAQAGRRYDALVKRLKNVDADVITINESMPAHAFAHRLADDLGMDCHARTALLGLAFGWLRFPFISEGDAILAKPWLRMRRANRAALSGRVLNESLALNFEDARQIVTSVVSPRPGVSVLIGSVHWAASVLDDAATRADLSSMPKTAQAAGQLAIERGTATRCEDALGTSGHILGELIKSGAEAVILGGDLNTVASTREFKHLCAFTPCNWEQGWDAADRGVANECTWDPDNPCVRMQESVEGPERNAVEQRLYERMGERSAKLDHVLYSCKQRGAMQVLRSSIVAMDSISDHHGVLVEFGFS